MIKLFRMFLECVICSIYKFYESFIGETDSDMRFLYTFGGLSMTLVFYVWGILFHFYKFPKSQNIAIVLNVILLIIVIPILSLTFLNRNRVEKFIKAIKQKHFPIWIRLLSFIYIVSSIFFCFYQAIAYL